MPERSAGRTGPAAARGRSQAPRGASTTCFSGRGCRSRRGTHAGARRGPRDAYDRGYIANWRSFPLSTLQSRFRDVHRPAGSWPARREGRTARGPLAQQRQGLPEQPKRPEDRILHVASFSERSCGSRTKLHDLIRFACPRPRNGRPGRDRRSTSSPEHREEPGEEARDDGNAEVGVPRGGEGRKGELYGAGDEGRNGE